MSSVIIGLVSLIIGVLIGFVAVSFVVAVGVRYKSKKGEFALAFWDEEQKVWQVRGHYLSIGGRIHRTMKTNPEKVKYKY